MLSIVGLTPLELFRLRVAGKPEIVEDEIAPGLVCFSVMKGIGNADTYSDAWTRECRGITFNAQTGKVASRPFHKFFNVNERESTQVNKLDWSKVVRVMDKRDGSMIHPILVNGYVRFKSKKTLESDVAIAAEKFMAENKNFETFCHYLLKTFHSTPIFEWTSPINRIVLGYEKPELKLTHIRYNEGGEYYTGELLRALAAERDIPVVDEVTEFTSFEQMLEAAKTREEIEGWVIQFEDGEMVKVKTEWYMKRHRAMTFFRERDVAVLVLDEQIDDVKAMLAGDGIDISPIIEVENRLYKELALLINEVKQKYEADKHLTARECAAKHKGTPHFGLVMAKYNQKEPAYEEFFRKNMLKQSFGLAPLGVLLGRQETADAED